jgi:hypothetical protein
MAVKIVCPRCGARDSFMKGYLPETCVCRVCQSQLGWREIPGCGPDCKAVVIESPPPPQAHVTSRAGEEEMATEQAAGVNPAAEDMLGREHGEGDR